MSLSLRSKLILPLFVIGTLFALVGAWVLLWVAEDHMRDQSVERSRLLAVAINESVEVMSGYEEIRFAVEDIVASKEGISGITVVTRDPFVIWASSFHPGVNDDRSSQRMLKALTESTEHGTFGHYLLPGGDILTLYPLLTQGYRSEQYRELFQQSAHASSSSPWGRVLAETTLNPETYEGAIYLRLDSSAINKGTTDIFIRSAAILLFSVVSLAVLAYLVFRYIVLMPVSKISDSIARQKAGDSGNRVQLQSSDEIGQLGASFNTMLDTLTERDQRFRTVVDHLPVAVSLKSREGDYQLTNNKFDLWMGDLSSHAAGWSAESLKKRAEFEYQVQTLMTDLTFEESVRQVDGSERYFMTTVFPVCDASGHLNAVGSASTDITDRKANEQEIRELAYFDNLTTLPNRRLFGDRLNQALKNAKRQGTVVGLVYMDLDGFKSVNDTLGHQAGDQLLQEVSQRLLSAVRAQDTVARLGGDEFTMIIVDLDPHRAQVDLATIATKVRDSIAKPIQLESQQTFVTSSLGIALYPDNAVTSDELIINADIAMYHAKSSGRDGYRFYQSDMNEVVHERRRVEDQLRTALENHELAVHYQPKVDTVTGELVGAEALLRWTNPLLGEVPPLRFIPIAEDSGLIIPIGSWVIETVISNLQQWRREGIVLPKIAVNLSPRQLRDERFAQKVCAMLRAAALTPDNLEFEITEGVFLQEVEHSHSSLYKLRESGVGLTIDDFGTGFSSLSYLKKLPVSTVKIDKSFVEGVAVDPVDEDIVTAIIAMAHSMHLSVVAEGVETHEQFDFLRSVHCDASQGWLISEAMPMEAFGHWLRERMAPVEVS